MTRSRFDANEITRIAEELQAIHGEAPTTRTVLEQALKTIPDAEQASITAHLEKDAFVTLGSTAALAADLDDAQYSLGERPCIDSSRGAEWRRSSDLTAESRWPSWAPVAVQHGIHSMLSIRLDSNGEPFGALNLYSTKVGGYADRDEFEFALLYAVHAANAMNSARLVAGLETAMTSRHVIGLAQGILIERYGLSIDQSLGFLRRISQDSNRKLRDVAQELVDSGVVPEPPGPKRWDAPHRA